MVILFRTSKLQEQCSDDRLAGKTWGRDRAFALRKRLDDLSAAQSLEHMRQLPGRCEELREDRAGQLSVRLDKNFRLIFEPAHEPVSARPDGRLDWVRVDRIRILEVVDYHG